MKIALLADAHANHPALEAVLKDIEKRKIDEIWYLGDFVGYGPYPDKVIKILKKKAARSIIGNYDVNVLRFPKKKDRWKETKGACKYFSFRWTYRHLGEKEKMYLKNLDRQLRIRCAGKDFLLVHGSPEKIDEPLREETSGARFGELAQKSKADVILCGHTHVFFDKQVAGTRFINPGSIGRPFDGDARSSYAILEEKNGQLTAENIRLGYNVEKLIRRMKKEKFPAPIAESIRRGISLDEILKIKETEHEK